MLVKISKNLLIDTEEILSVEKSSYLGAHLIICFKNRPEPRKYYFCSHDERNEAFKKLIKKD